MTEVKIPKGWLRLQIGEITEVVAGGTPKAGNPTNFAAPSSSVAWLTPADLSKYSKKYISHGKRDLSHTGLNSSSAKLIPAGSILFSSRAPIGYVAIAKNEISTNQGFKNFVLPTGIDSSFAYYYLRSIRDLAESLGTGTTFKEISGATAKTLPFTIPPLAEQKVIADNLDILLAQVETTKARLDRIPQILKTFRKSVLTAAVSGKLTEEWRVENGCSTPHNYRQVCEKEREEYFDKKPKKLVDIEKVPDIKLPDNWVWQSLDASSLKITDGTHFSPKSTSIGDFMYVTSKNVRAGYIDLSKISYIDEVTHREIYQRCDVKKGDVLYVKDGANTGLACVNSIEEEISLLSSVGVFKVCSFVNPSYLEHYLNSPTGRELMLGMMGGTAIPRLTLTKLAKAPFALPPFEEQTEIVRRVEQLFAHADKIEQQVQTAQKRVDKLTQSILAKAFRGELTAQWRNNNPELISGDNSAEALLERIKAERESLKAKKNKRITKKVMTKPAKQREEIESKSVLGVIAKHEKVLPQQLFDELKGIASLQQILSELSELLKKNKISELHLGDEKYLVLKE
jgi:type I restriction enzyme S subunit